MVKKKVEGAELAPEEEVVEEQPEEEAAEAAPEEVTHEPDTSEAEPEAEPTPDPEEAQPDPAEVEVMEADLPGTITELSPEKFKKLTQAWHIAGKPNTLRAMGSEWLVVDNGAKFVDRGPPRPMGHYDSLSTISEKR